MPNRRRTRRRRHPDIDPAYDTIYEAMCLVWHPAIAAIEAHLHMERQAS